jgi:hypothetical protein
MIDDSLLVGETILFKVFGQEKKGVVMGVVTIKNHYTDIFATSAFTVLTDKTGTIETIPYHQIIGIIEPDITFLELLEKEGDLVNINFPKYYKPAHPKGWNLEGESNTDLPFS